MSRRRRKTHRLALVVAAVLLGGPAWAQQAGVNSARGIESEQGRDTGAIDEREQATFTHLRGVDRVYAERLEAAGIRTFEELALLSPDDLSRILEISIMEVLRKDLTIQAKKLVWSTKAMEARIREGKATDFRRLEGIDLVLCARLHDAGITSFARLAELTPRQLGKVLRWSPERVVEENILGQARQKVADIQAAKSRAKQGNGQARGARRAAPGPAAGLRGETGAPGEARPKKPQVSFTMLRGVTAEYDELLKRAGLRSMADLARMTDAQLCNILGATPGRVKGMNLNGKARVLAEKLAALKAAKTEVVSKAP